MSVENILNFFQKLGNPNYRSTQSEIDTLFAKDFVMIANGKHVCDYHGLLEHFDHISKQIGETKIKTHELVISKNKQVARYDLISDVKGTTHVIAIFKFHEGETKAYEMNEVFHNTNGQIIDVSK